MKWRPLIAHLANYLNRTPRAKQRFGWGKFSKFYFYIEYLSQLNSFGPPNCTYHQTLGAVHQTAPTIIGPEYRLWWWRSWWWHFYYSRNPATQFHKSAKVVEI